jgi:hypothetical protein
MQLAALQSQCSVRLRIHPQVAGLVDDEMRGKMMGEAG